MTRLLVLCCLLGGCGAQGKWTWQGVYDCELRDHSHRLIATDEWTPYVGVGNSGWLENQRTHEQFDMGSEHVQWCRKI